MTRFWAFEMPLRASAMVAFVLLSIWYLLISSCESLISLRNSVDRAVLSRRFCARLFFSFSSSRIDSRSAPTILSLSLITWSQVGHVPLMLSICSRVPRASGSLAWLIAASSPLSARISWSICCSLSCAALRVSSASLSSIPPIESMYS